MKKRLEDEIGMSSEALADMDNKPAPIINLDYDLPPNEPSINISDYLPNNENEQHPLAPSVYKSLAQLVRQPGLAQQLELPDAEPETEYLSKSEIEKRIREKRKAMEKAAKDLDFMQAAKFRDEIKALQGKLN